MSVGYAIGVVVGLDAEDANDARGQNFIQRFRAGDLPHVQEDSEGSALAFEEWWVAESHALPGGGDLDAYGAGFGQHGGPARVLLGLELARIEYQRLEPSYGGPIRRADLTEAARQAQAAFRALGIKAEPRVYLRNNVS